MYVHTSCYCLILTYTDDIDLNLNENLKSNHEYEVPPELNLPVKDTGTYISE